MNPAINDIEERRGDEEEVASAEELMAPPLGVAKYLRYGLGLLARSSDFHPHRLARSVASFAAFSAPVLMVCSFAWFATPGVAGESFAGVGINESLVPPWWGLPVLLLSLLAAVVIRAMLDARIFAAYREASGDASRRPRGWLRRVSSVYAAVGLLQLAVLLGASLLLAPIAVRVLVGMLENPGALPHPVFHAAIIGVGGTLVSLRLIAMLVSAYLPWRPDFLTDTLFAAFGVPGHSVKTFVHLLFVWCLTFGVLSVGAVWMLLHAVVRFTETGVVCTALDVVVFLLLWSGLAVVDHCMDATLVGMAGHRIGVIPTRAVEENLGDPPTVAPHDERIPAHPAGWFRADRGAGPSSPSTYAAVLGTPFGDSEP